MQDGRAQQRDERHARVQRPRGGDHEAQVQAGREDGLEVRRQRFLAVVLAQLLEHGLAAEHARLARGAGLDGAEGGAPLEVLARVHWPLLRPSLAAAALLVAVDCLKELPATLVLRPFDFDTLAVAAYHFAADERLAEAAVPSLLIVLAGLVPVLMLSRASGGRDQGGSP